QLMHQLIHYSIRPAQQNYPLISDSAIKSRSVQNPTKKHNSVMQIRTGCSDCTHQLPRYRSMHLTSDIPSNSQHTEPDQHPAYTASSNPAFIRTDSNCSSGPASQLKQLRRTDST
ncbi:unnamed protein product, partial [Ilex paraguariensis]